MKITMRLIFSLVTAVTFVVLVFTTVQVYSERRILLTELDKRATVAAETFWSGTHPLISRKNAVALRPMLQRVAEEHGLAGLALFDNEDNLVIATKSLTDS